MLRATLLLGLAIATSACAPVTPPPPPPAAPSGPVPILPDDFAWAAGRYEQIRAALVAGSAPAASQAARWMAVSAKSAASMLAREPRGLGPADAATAIELEQQIAAAATKLAQAPDIAAARAAFADLTKPMIAWRQRTSGALPAVACCARTGQCWLQPAGAPAGNPYDPAATDCDAE